MCQPSWSTDAVHRWAGSSMRSKTWHNWSYSPTWPVAIARLTCFIAKIHVYRSIWRYPKTNVYEGWKHNYMYTIEHLYIYIHCILIAYWLITTYYYYAYTYVHTRVSVQSLFIPYVHTLQSFDSPRVKPLMLGFSMTLHSQQHGAFSFWFGGPKLVGSIWNFRTRPVGF